MGAEPMPKPDAVAIADIVACNGDHMQSQFRKPR